MADDKTPEQLRLEAFSTDGMRCKGGCGGESEFCGADMLRFAASEVQRDREEAANGSAPETQRVDVLRDGEPCEHAGCLRHVSHPCEGCGRIAGRAARPALDVEGLAKAFEYVLQMRSHLCDDPELPKVARDLAETAVEFIGKNGGR